MAIKSDFSRGCRPEEARSHAFLLRCWQEPGADPDGASVWRFSLTLVNREREKKGFANLESLLAFLQERLEAPE